MRWFMPFSMAEEGYNELFNCGANTERFLSDLCPLDTYALSDGSLAVVINIEDSEALEELRWSCGYATIWYESARDRCFGYNIGFTMHRPFKKEVQTRYDQLRRWAQEEVVEREAAAS